MTRPNKRSTNNRRSRQQAALRPQATRTVGSPEPPAISNTITVNYRLQSLITGITTALPFVINPNVVGGLLPGQTNAWAQFRVKKIEMWGSDATTNTSIFLTVAEVNSAGAQFQSTVYNDFGTQGVRRPHICVRPGSLFELSWFSTNDTSVALFVLGTDSATPFDIIYQMTVELRSVSAAIE